jgi:hypothetical protein
MEFQFSTVYFLQKCDVNQLISNEDQIQAAIAASIQNGAPNLPLTPRKNHSTPFKDKNERTNGATFTIDSPVDSSASSPSNQSKPSADSDLEAAIALSLNNNPHIATTVDDPVLRQIMEQSKKQVCNTSPDQEKKNPSNN